MTITEINKKYADLKTTKECLEKAVKYKDNPPDIITNICLNYDILDILKIAHECVVFKMDYFINKDWK